MRQLVDPGAVGARRHDGCGLRSTSHPATERTALVILPASSTRKGGEACITGVPLASTNSSTLLASRSPETPGGRARTYSIVGVGGFLSNRKWSSKPSRVGL